MYTFKQLERILNLDLTVTIYMYMLFNKTYKSLEGRFRRQLHMNGNQTILYIFDLMMEDKHNVRRSDGLLKFVWDDTEYLPTKCNVPINTVICPYLQNPSDKLRKYNEYPKEKDGFSLPINQLEIHPPILWHKCDGLIVKQAFH